MLVADVAVVALSGVTAPWTVPTSAIDNGGTGWVVVFASFSVVVLQLHTSTVPGAVAVLLVDAALLGGIALSPNGSTWRAVSVAVWVVVEAALARLLWVLVQRGGTRSDVLAARAEASRRAAVVAAARRREERLHAAALHDTAATTLLMVGLGEVRRTDTWLPHQAGRDLQALDSSAEPGDAADDQIDLARALTDVVATALVQVALTVRSGVRVPRAVSAALCGATCEALNNVARHSGTTTAAVRLTAQDGAVRVEVSDLGVGFDPRRRSAFRRGVSGSIQDRVSDAGGRADVQSRAGMGTTVSLVWPAPADGQP